MYNFQKHGISKIINLSENCPRPESVPNNTNHFFRIPIKDSYSAKLLPHFDTAYEFLGKITSTSRILAYMDCF